MKLEKVLTHFRTRLLIRIACYLGLLALLMMSWSVLDPSALPVVVGMGFGQVVGVLAFGLYAIAVLGDIYRGDVDEVIPPSRKSLRPDDEKDESTWEEEDREEA